MKNSDYLKIGIKDGFPIALGYFAVSFALGIAARNIGLTSFEAALMSFTSLSSTGQFAGLNLIAANASYFEMFLTQIVVNIRYFLMSCALSQRIDFSMPFFHRFLLSFGVTDEIFAISVTKDKTLNPYYTYGAMLVSIPGWSLGTYLGVLFGNILPTNIVSALSVALYAMFVAIIIPPAKNNKIIALLVTVSMIFSYLFSRLSFLKNVSSGSKIIILTVVITGIASFIFPISEKEEEELE